MIAYPRMVSSSPRRSTVLTVPDLMCEHCRDAVSAELGGVAGVEAVAVDLERKLVVVDGDGLRLPALRAAVERAGYRVEP
jgi:copper chaperone